MQLNNRKAAFQELKKVAQPGTSAAAAIADLGSCCPLDRGPEGCGWSV